VDGKYPNANCSPEPERDNNLYAVEALVRAGFPSNRLTDFLAANLAMSRGGDGGWHLPGYSRSPIQDSDFSRTAMGDARLENLWPTRARR
jgi:hypothetical protein